MSRQQESSPTHSEGFVCIQCGRPVPPTQNGTAHRNHCPHCLTSRHVDIRPGDRRAGCRSSMSPIAVSVTGKTEWSIIHRCDRCGIMKSNRIAGDDDEAVLLALAVGPLSRLPFPVESISQSKRASERGRGGV
ncbi:MAG: RNHCP domain-containing protein [Spirochaetaceae bacterium]|nr:MAG: RNHCP domain-containing protein [Spirochaetaceae bacterium]